MLSGHHIKETPLPAVKAPKFVPIFAVKSTSIRQAQTPIVNVAANGHFYCEKPVLIYLPAFSESRRVSEFPRAFRRIPKF